MAYFFFISYLFLFIHFYRIDFRSLQKKKKRKNERKHSFQILDQGRQYILSTQCKLFKPKSTLFKFQIRKKNMLSSYSNFYLFIYMLIFNFNFYCSMKSKLVYFKNVLFFFSLWLNYSRCNPKLSVIGPLKKYLP